jgi:tRNA 2-selenouridine synthase
MVDKISIEEFLLLKDLYPVIDVRSEKEFNEGHIPGVFNVPILNDEERKIVGTTYKHNGRHPAVYKGLELTGPHLTDLLRKGVSITKQGKVLVHCWRGGMRSEFYSFLLKFYGLEPLLLEGGYKSYRAYVHTCYDRKLNIRVLGGRTGSGKTILLHELKKLGEQVIDLEGLAHHRGSSFGALGMTDAPTQEQFENELFTVLQKIDPSRTVWIEDESRTIGDKVIPEGIWKQMKATSRVVVNRSFDERLDQIEKDYGLFPVEDLKISMHRIGKRLGPQHVKRALELLDEGELRESFAIALGYYDRAYEYNLKEHNSGPFTEVDGIGLDYSDLALKIINS